MGDTCLNDALNPLPADAIYRHTRCAFPRQASGKEPQASPACARLLFGVATLKRARPSWKIPFRIRGKKVHNDSGLILSTQAAATDEAR